MPLLQGQDVLFSSSTVLWLNETYRDKHPPLWTPHLSVSLIQQSRLMLINGRHCARLSVEAAKWSSLTLNACVSSPASVSLSYLVDIQTTWKAQGRDSSTKFEDFELEDWTDYDGEMNKLLSGSLGSG